MRLTHEHVAGWCRIIRRPDQDEANYLAQTKERAAEPEWLARRFAAVVEDEVVGVTWLSPTGTDRWLIGAPRTPVDQPIGRPVAALIAEAVASLRQRGAVAAGMRVPLDRESDALRAVLDATGAERTGERIEYKTPLDALPHEAPGPLTWVPAGARALPRFARLLLAVSSGPDGLESDEDPDAWLHDVLNDPSRVTDPAACLHAGQLDGSDVALVVAQTEPDSGWATLPFMGVVPAARGRGLGHVVHRHGIAMLRAQGATLYHGGTSAENTAMRACFVGQGCREWQRFAEWSWPATVLQPGV